MTRGGVIDPARGRPRLPAEWEPQRCVLLAWPHGDTDWAPVLQQVETEYLELLAAILPRSPVVLCCRDRDHARYVGGLIDRRGLDTARATMVTLPYNDTWIRDYGPLTLLRNGAAELVDFSFNGWGGRHLAGLDDQVSARLHGAGALGNLPFSRRERVLEGGSIDSDGMGTLLTTSRCLLHRNRGGDSGRESMERALMTWLGADRILWLDHGGLDGDDTDGHIDMLARFCSARTIVYSNCEDAGDVHYEPMRQMYEQLKSFRARDGGAYRLVPLPLPRPVHAADGHRLPASYANFLVVNGAVIVPAYADPCDQRALASLQRCFPGHEVVATSARTLITQGGGVHCATLSLFAGRETRRD